MADYVLGYVDALCCGALIEAPGHLILVVAFPFVRGVSYHAVQNMNSLSTANEMSSSKIAELDSRFQDTEFADLAGG